MSVEKMRAFIIKVVFYCMIAGIVFLSVKYALPILKPFIIGFFFAFLLKPLVNWITKKSGIKRRVVAVLTLIVFYLVLVAAFTILGTRIVVLVKDLFDGLPEFYKSVMEPTLFAVQGNIEHMISLLNPTLLSAFESLGDSIAKTLYSAVTTISTSALGWATGFASSLPSAFINVVITIVTSFFCVVDYYKITTAILSIFSEKTRAMVFEVKSKGLDVLFNFGKAYLRLMSITCVELVIGLMLLRIDNALLIALCTAVIDILPVLGVGTILLPWGITNLILGNFPLGFGILILYLIIVVVRQALEPRIVGKQIGLYPLITLVCMFVGASLFGFFGLFGLPIAATVFVQIQRDRHAQTQTATK
ncbi:MAG: sporulation integral membrane protein YtvI [Ruthenibacterium sp.]